MRINIKIMLHLAQVIIIIKIIIKRNNLEVKNRNSSIYSIVISKDLIIYKKVKVLYNKYLYLIHKKLVN